MRNSKVRKIDYAAERLALAADKYYNEGKFVPALRLAYRQYETYGGDGDVYARLADIYESMGLHASAVNWLYRFMDVAAPEDYPDIVEGLAVNYLNMGQENASAYYYNKLIDVDSTLPEETKEDILDAFSKPKNERFRFVYPPELADYSKELEQGSRALKNGDCRRAVQVLGVVEKGSKQYAHAKEMQAVAYLLAGDEKQAENICLELLETQPDDTRVLATLAAVYLEQGRKDESREIALRLAEKEQTEADDLYKVATVCCENGLHERAYEKFCLLEDKIPFDGRMLYFKAVAAYKSGKYEQAEKAFDLLCSVYPDAEVAKYYLRTMRVCEGKISDPGEEPDYLYHLPQAERESRCKSLLKIGGAPKDEAQLFGLIALHDGYFRWCFDEMDGADHDLQYLALVTAEHVRADEFLCDILLDPEVLDVLKVETLRMLCARNEDADLGVVICNIYRRVPLYRIKIGRKKRKRFIDGYAKVVSRFAVIQPEYAKRLKVAAETLYVALNEKGTLDLIQTEDEVAAAIYLLAGLKELGSDAASVAKAFDTDENKLRALIASVLDDAMQTQNHTGENKV